MITKTSLLSILTVSTSFAFDLEGIKSPKIIGGLEATPGEFPYYVQMNGCGGSLVAPDIVLTAAHCQAMNDTQVSISAYKYASLDNGAESRFCEEWIADPMYDDFTISNDFALCKLDRPIETENKIMFEVNEDVSFLSEGDDLIVMGLGLVDNDGWGEGAEILQEATVPLLSNEECNKEDSYNGKITDVMFCAGYPETGGKDSCQGDSGGPIVKRTINDNGSIVDTQVGVVSWGYGCAEKGFPGVYADISKRADWIKETMCNDLKSIASFCNNQDESSRQDVCDGVELTVEVNTDKYASETSWSLIYPEDNTVVKKRSYLINNNKNVHKVCLKSDGCYSWELRDEASDGLCSFSGCGSYSLALNDKPIYFGDGDFSNRESKYFCTNKAIFVTNAPTPTPFDGRDDDVDTSASEDTGSKDHSTTMPSFVLTSKDIVTDDIPNNTDGSGTYCNIAPQIDCTIVGPGDLAGASCDVLHDFVHATCPVDHNIFMAALEYDGSLGQSIFAVATCSDIADDYEERKLLNNGDFFFFFGMCDAMTFTIYTSDPHNGGTVIESVNQEIACPGPWTLGNEIAPGLKLSHYDSYSENGAFVNIEHIDIQIDYLAVNTARDAVSNPATLVGGEISANGPFQKAVMNGPVVFDQPDILLYREAHKMNLLDHTGTALNFSLTLKGNTADHLGALCEPSSSFQLQL